MAIFPGTCPPNTVTLNSITSMLEVGGSPIANQPPNWYNVNAYGGDPTGATDSSQAIIDTLTDIPANIIAASNNSYAEGGVIYLSRGRYKLDSLIDCASGQTATGTRVNLTFQGDGPGATVLFSSTLTSFIAANTAVDNITFRDLSFYCSAQYTGLGTLEVLIDLFGCTNVVFQNVRINVTKSVARNTDCVLINMDQCWSPLLINVFTFTTLNTSTEYHNVDKTANTGIMGGTHIRNRDANSLQMYGCRWQNAYRSVHLINDDGAYVTGGHMAATVQGFLLDGCQDCVIDGVRYEVHPEDAAFGQYDGPEEHYLVMCDETSRYNRVINGEAWKLKSKYPQLGYIDKNGTNRFDLNNITSKTERLPLTRNGNFAMGPYTDTTVKVPGWAILGASVLTEETSDLPPEPGITRVMDIVTTANGRGIKTKPFAVDPEKIGVLLWKFWMKRVSGDHALKFVLVNAAGNTITADRFTAMRGAPTLSDNLTGFAITGTPTWSGGFLTITSRTKHFFKVNQTCVLAGFTVTGGGTDPDGSHLVTSIIDDYTFVVAASDPVTISVVGTYGRSGHDDICDMEEWVEYTGHIEVRLYVKEWVDAGGGNVTFTLAYGHMIENSVTSSVKLWGFADPLWNATHTIVSTGGIGSTTLTIARPIGAADPVDVSSGDTSLRVDGSSWTGDAFYGWGGMIGDVTAEFRSVFVTGVNTTAKNRIGGFVLKPMAGTMEISDAYLPGVETFVAKKTFDWPSCAAAGEQSTTVTVPGAEIGDGVTFGLSVDNASLQKSAAILTTGVATCVIYNPTGAPIDLASGVITVTVTHVY